MDRKKRLEGIDTAAVAAVYGLGGSIPTYEQFVQLWLNIDYQLGKKAFYDCIAAIVGASKEAIPEEWLKAAIPTQIEASQWRKFDLRRSLKN